MFKTAWLYCLRARLKLRGRCECFIFFSCTRVLSAHSRLVDIEVDTIYPKSLSYKRDRLTFFGRHVKR